MFFKRYDFGIDGAFLGNCHYGGDALVYGEYDFWCRSLNVVFDVGCKVMFESVKMCVIVVYFGLTFFHVTVPWRKKSSDVEAS